ncbi:MAG: Hsp70 family protein, partial [Mycolicibacterium sp.]|nr:Hsp70 family protein [Mycolicibacterium sp.]
MSDSLGLSVGTTNLVAAAIGRPPVVRRAALALFNDRAPEVGDQFGPTQPNLVLTGFVERVGDPVPMVASDGSSHRGEVVLVEALDAMARAVGGGAPVTIAVPAHWNAGVVGALRNALRNKPNLSPGGVPPTLVPDSTAALSALRVAPGLPTDGVVVLCDFGANGTSVTLADARAGMAVIGDTIRYPDFSGDLVDQSLLNHVISGVADASNPDPAGTAAVGSLTRLRDDCRQAKERLSADTAAVIPVALPGFSSDVRVTRPELERLIDQPINGLMGAIEQSLQQFRIPMAAITAVATVGGGASIPLVTQRLSERLRAPVVTTPQPQVVGAAGAAVLSAGGLGDDATGLAPVADDATGLAPTMGWVAGAGAAGVAAGAAAGAAFPTQAAPSAADTSAADSLAWSQGVEADDPLPYADGEYDYGSATDARPPVDFAARDEPYDDDEPGPLPWYKRPPLLFGAAAAAALLAVGGLAVTLTSTSTDSTPVTENVTITSTGDDGRVTTTVVPSSEAETYRNRPLTTTPPA